MKLSRNQIVLIGLGAILIVAIVVLVYLYRRPPQAGSEVKFTVWGMDSREVFESIIGGYKTLQPGATVTYTQIDAATYGATLLNALAAGTGPDAFEIANSELPRQESKLIPADAGQFNIVKMRELFPQAAEQDFASASGSQIYALPLCLDTLALIYNRDFFDTAGIVSPPKTWDDFLRIVPQLKVVSPAGGITRAAAAIGGSEKTMNAAADILELLMLQNGARMTSPQNDQASFANITNNSTTPGIAAFNPGVAAFNFYLQFANVASPYYTWNDGQANSLDSFVNGKAAMIFDYARAVADIKIRSPFLNFAVAPMPQPKGASVDVNFPEYMGLAVSKQSKVSGWAWDFVIYATTNQSAVKMYLDGTACPPALKSSISAYMSDPNLGIFVKQALSARSWHQADDLKIENIMNNAIQGVLTGQANSGNALSRAQDQVTALMHVY